MRRGSWIAAGFVALSVAIWTESARADDAACVDASEKAIFLRRDGKLQDARAALAICADATCPDEVKAECESRLVSVSALTPTLILVAKTAAGEDVANGVDVTIDGAAIAAGIDGRPRAFDPGAHTLVVTMNGRSETRALVLREGEKNRREVFTVHPLGFAEPKVGRDKPATDNTQSWSTQKLVGVAVMGAGFVGVGLGATFGIVAASEKSSEQAECTRSACPSRDASQKDYDRATTDATGSTISFIAGGALIAGGAVLFLTGGSSSPGNAVKPSKSAFLLVPVVSADQRGLLFRARF